MARGARITIPNIPLIDGEPRALQFEEFDVWAPNAKIKLFDADGKSTDLRRPSIRTFRGTVAGDPDSMAFLSLGKGVTGFVITGDRKFVLSSRPRPHLVSRRAVVDADVAIVEVPPQDEVVPAEGGFSCDLEQHSFGSVPAGMHAVRESVREPRTNGLATSTATYALNLAIDSDPALVCGFPAPITWGASALRQVISLANTTYGLSTKT